MPPKDWPEAPAVAVPAPWDDYNWDANIALADFDAMPQDDHFYEDDKDGPDEPDDCNDEDGDGPDIVERRDDYVDIDCRDRDDW